jgi:hypothetical protein
VLFGAKKDLFGVDKLLETNRDFPGPKKAIYSKTCVYNETKKYQERLVR